MSERLAKILQMLEAKPGDTFLLYAAAMEHKKLNDLEKALEFLDRTVQFDPLYAYAFFQKGQVLEMAGDTDLARQAYLAGIDAARQKNDSHAVSELQGALDMLG